MECIFYSFRLSKPFTKVYGAKACCFFKLILASPGSLAASSLAVLLSTIPPSVEYPSNTCAKPPYSWREWPFWPSPRLKATMVMWSLSGSTASSMGDTIMRSKCTSMRKFGPETLLGHGGLPNWPCPFPMPLEFRL